MTSKEYFGEPAGEETPGVSYSYDVHNPEISLVTSYPKGRVTRVVSGGTARTVDSYDALGRVTRSTQETGGTKYRFGNDTATGYSYLRNGSLDMMRLPSGRQVFHEYDDAGRAKRVTSGGKEFVASVSYEPQ